MGWPTTWVGLWLATVWIVPGLGTGAESGWAERRFAESDRLLANPGQGWMSAQRRPPQSPRLPYSVAYVRFNWADVEPEEGRFNWSVLDEVIAAWQAQGGTVGFRVMTCNPHSRGYYSAPAWLFAAGCKGREYLRGGADPTEGGARLLRIEPDYADPIYLAKHGAFLRAWGARYDGHPGVEFVDIGSYGLWGEWHTPHPAPVSVRQRIVDLYLEAFRRTPLVAMSDDAEVLAYALDRGTGLRRDGVGSPWHERNWIGSAKYAAVTNMADAWQRAPVVFEWYGSYDYLRQRGWSFEAGVAFMLRNHVTLIHDNLGSVPPEARPHLERLARQAGARLVLRELAHPQRVRRGRDLEVRMLWANTGVGKLYRRYALQLLLVDAAGKVAWAAEAKADPRTWLPGEHRLTETLRLPVSLEAGDYRLAVGLRDPTGQRPPFRLAMEVGDQEGRYPVSQLIVE